MATKKPARSAPSPKPVEEIERVDGRSARRERNKIAVVDAYLDLIREGVARPAVTDVAERSGVSHRSVFRYFSDRDEMARTSIQRQHERVGPLFQQRVDEALPLADRIGELIELRMRLFDTIAPSARLSRALASTQPIIQDELTASRAFLRAAVKRLFAAELAAMSTEDAADTLAAVDVLTSFEAFDLLRTDRGLSKPRTARVLRSTLIALLG